LLRRLGSLHHFAHIQHLLVFDTGGMKRGLRAIAAVLGTAAGLDREQGGKLYRVRVKMFAGALVARDTSRSAKGSLNSASMSATDQRCGAVSLSMERTIKALRLEFAWQNGREI